MSSITLRWPQDVFCPQGSACIRITRSTDERKNPMATSHLQNDLVIQQTEGEFSPDLFYKKTEEGWIWGRGEVMRVRLAGMERGETEVRM